MTQITTIIGIDPGTETGIAIKDVETGAFVVVATLPIHRALDTVLHWAGTNAIAVVVEDASLRTWIPKESGREKLQGAGSIKRDCSIWSDFLTDHNIPHRMVKPAKGRTKWEPKVWQAATGWQGRTSNHARDAAVLVLGINSKSIKTLTWKIKA